MIIGNLTRDPEIKTTPSGQQVATFSVATSMVWKDQSGQKQEKAEFHNIVAWRRLAEICGQYLKKGSKIYLEGRLQTRDWTGQDGIKRYRTEIVAENMIMLDRAGNNTQSFGNQNSPTYGQQGAEQIIDESVPTGQNNNEYSEEDIKIENIPF
jgi:single-strand DNA-binding protein